MEVRPLAEADRPGLDAFLQEDPRNNVYVADLLVRHGLAAGKARFLGAFAGAELVGVLALGPEVHCRYAAISPAPVEAAVALGGELALPEAAVLLGPAEPVRTVLEQALPPERVRGASPFVLGIGNDDPGGAPAYPVRRATWADLRGLTDLYEAYEFDGYPTRRHVRWALAERIRGSAIYVVEREGRLAGARRVDACSSEVALFGGLTTDPEFRRAGIGRALRVASVADVRERGLEDCGLRHPGNPFLRPSD